MINDAVAYIKWPRGAAWPQYLNGRSARCGKPSACGAREALELECYRYGGSQQWTTCWCRSDGRSGRASTVWETVVLETVAGAADHHFQRAKLAHQRYSRLLPIPSVAYLLMLVGHLWPAAGGLQPRCAGPARRRIGGICLLLALFAFQVLPVNYAGLASDAARRVALMIAESFAPSFGVLGIGGLAAFVFGSIILMDS